MLGGLLLLIAFGQAGVSSPATLAQQAHDDFQAGRYAQAREKLHQALKSEPRNPAMWSYLGMTDAQLDDLDAAIVDFLKTLALAPDDSQSYFNLGLLYGRKDDAGKAMEAYRHGLAIEPANGPANQNYAVLLMEQKQFPEAIGPLTVIRGTDAGNLDVRTALVECYLKSGRQDDAAKEIQAYMELPNVAANDQLKLAKVLLENNQPASAQALLESAVKTPPESPEAHYDLGLLLLNKNQYENAVRELGRAVQLAPEPSRYSMKLAEGLLFWKHYGTAFEFLKAVQDRFATLPDYRYKLGLALYGLHRFPEAIAQFEGMIREQSNSELVYFFLGNCQVAVGHLEEAVVQFRKAIALQPRNASFYTALAQALRKISDDNTDEAIADLEKALSIDSTDIQITQELALCLVKKRNYARAQDLLEQVVRRDPELVSAHVALATIYYRVGKKLEADGERETVLRLESKERARQSQLLNSPERPHP